MKLYRNMKWRFSIITIIVLIVLPMVPYSTTPNTTVIANDDVPTKRPRHSIGPPYKAALMVGGDETDLGFSYVAIQGMYMLESVYGWNISISRQVPYPDQYRIADEYGAAGYDVVFCVGGQFIETTYFSGVAEKHNQTLFVQIPGLNPYVPAPNNTVGLHPSFQTRGHYLAGILSGLMTNTGRVGVVFGEWYEYLAMEFYAYEAGVKSVNNDTCVFARVAGTWGDAAIGKQVTKTLIDTKNVDIIVQVADTTGRGVIAACVEAGITVIGTVADQYLLAPLNTMTSIGMDTTRMMELAVQYVENGTAMSELGGLSWELHIGDFLYPYHYYNDTIPQSVKDYVDNVKNGIDNGSIIVPQISTENPPADPTNCPGADEVVIPGFPPLYLALVLATMLGVMLLLVNRSRIISKKLKS